MTVFEIYYTCRSKANKEVTHVVQVEVSANTTQEAIRFANSDVKYRFPRYTDFVFNRAVKVEK